MGRRIVFIVSPAALLTTFLCLIAAPRWPWLTYSWLGLCWGAVAVGAGLWWQDRRHRDAPGQLAERLRRHTLNDGMEFDSLWIELAVHGLVDDVGGAEYRRVRSEFDREQIRNGLDLVSSANRRP